MVKDCDLKYGTKIEIEQRKGEPVIKKKESVREGWDDAFAQYAKKDEDKPLLPDFLDAETDMLL